MSWAQLAAEDPELARFGEVRLKNRVAYLATVTEGASPRVHPVEAILGGGRLFVFMEPTSLKAHDLRRNGRYALHCGVLDLSGRSGEFLVRGSAAVVNDPEARALAASVAKRAPADQYLLFELDVAHAVSTVYEGGQPVRTRWVKQSR
jgi:Pyridoxamine 5'-phosphate oxidase